MFELPLSMGSCTHGVGGVKLRETGMGGMIPLDGHLEQKCKRVLSDVTNTAFSKLCLAFR